MSVHQLTTQNFHVAGQQTQSLSINYSGNVLVLFKLQDCPGCAAFEPVFHQLAREETRVVFAVLDLAINRDVGQMSRSTTTPIQKVPHLILYIQGRPHARFTGAQKTFPAIRNFISDALQSSQQNLQQQQHSFVQQNIYGGPQQAPRGFMPEIQPPKQAIRMAQGLGGYAHPSMQQQCDSDNPNCLMMPNQIVPHNIPWETEKRDMS